MCGIIVEWSGQNTIHKKVLKQLIRRGPDEYGCYRDKNIVMAHTRLSIVHPEAGAQPIRYKEWVLVVNGEIYNATPDVTETDCYALIQRIESMPLTDALLSLDGIFSFVAYHSSGRIIVARDPIGVTPLYYSDTQVSSLLTYISIGSARPVPPGHVADIQLGQPLRPECFVKWTRPYEPRVLRNPVFMMSNIMYQAVSKRLMGDVPWGVLLSGGLDSTIVAAIATEIAAEKRPDYPRVHSFCIGLKGSPDVEIAEKTAAILGTHHTSVIFTLREGRAALKDVIRAIETYDVTTIRASVPMWLLGRALKRRGIKMVLSGEGSDELFAGYLYNLYCPNTDEMTAECKRKMDQLWAYDCLRANKTMGDWGVETRVPFLDNAVVDFAMNQLPPVYKMSGTHPDGPKPEKWWLRDQFKSIVPDCVLNRTKAQFSDAVGSRWIQYLQTLAETRVTDKQLASAAEKFPYQTPDTKEAYWYRQMFENMFSHVSDAEKTVLYQPSIACSTAKAVEWHEAFRNHTDPSGAAVQMAIQSDSQNL